MFFFFRIFQDPDNLCVFFFFYQGASLCCRHTEVQILQTGAATGWDVTKLTKKVVFDLFFGLLYCTVLYCTVLYCTVLYCTVLYCTVLYCTVLYCTVLYCTVLYCTVLYCTVLYCTVLYCTVLYCTVRKLTKKRELVHFGKLTPPLAGRIPEMQMPAFLSKF